MEEQTLSAFYLSKSFQCRQFFYLFPLNFIQALQMGYGLANPDPKYNRYRASLMQLIEQEGNLEQALSQQTFWKIGNTWEACRAKIFSKNMGVYIYEWSNGKWGSHLKRVRTYAKNPPTSHTPVIQVLQHEGRYYLMYRTPNKDQPFILN